MCVCGGGGGGGRGEEDLMLLCVVPILKEVVLKGRGGVKGERGGGGTVGEGAGQS